MGSQEFSGGSPLGAAGEQVVEGRGGERFGDEEMRGLKGGGNFCTNIGHSIVIVSKRRKDGEKRPSGQYKWVLAMVTDIGPCFSPLLLVHSSPNAES